MSKKIELIEAASRVILKSGVHSLTLEAVAIEAEVSKGGLLYHYASKDDLIKAMNMHVIGQFRDLIEDELKEGMSYHQAYLRATLRSLREINYINISTSMLAAISNNRDILQLWREEYEVINDKLTKENYPREHTLMVHAICDGIWFSNLFNMPHIGEQDAERLVAYMLDVLEAA